MTRVLLEDITTNEDAWLAQKLNSIGSGDIACIAGADEFKTPLKLWAVKTRRQPPDPENDHMWWGKVMEPAIAKLCARRLGINVRHANTLFGHDEIPWATATPDYFADLRSNHAFGVVDLKDGGAPVGVNTFDESPSIVECKNVSFRQRSKWADGTPLAPRIQVMWQMGITGIRRSIVTPLIGGDIFEFEPRLVDFDQHIFEQLVELADKFMWCVKNDVPPAPRAEDAQLVERIVGALRDVSIELPSNMEPVFKGYEVLTKNMSTHKKAMEAFDNERLALRSEIRLAMGSAARATCGEYTAKATLVERAGHQVRPSSYTRFNVKRVGVDDEE